MLYQYLKIDHDSQKVTNMFFTTLEEIYREIKGPRLFGLSVEVDFYDFVLNFFACPDFTITINRIDGNKVDELLCFNYNNDYYGFSDADTDNESLLHYMDQNEIDVTPDILENIKQGNDLRYYNLVILANMGYDNTLLRDERDGILRALALRSQI